MNFKATVLIRPGVAFVLLCEAVAAFFVINFVVSLYCDRKFSIFIVCAAGDLADHFRPGWCELRPYSNK
jgi:hypothetical protein